MATVSFLAHGHPRITGNHTKTVELTRDPEVTGRATCVVGVRSEHDDRELARLRGNDDELSPRARRVLEVADIVLAEDTRRLRDLAQRTGMRIDGRIVSYHDHNEAARAGDVVDQIERGARVALVSDAGTPLFSDPG